MGEPKNKARQIPPGHQERNSEDQQGGLPLFGSSGHFSKRGETGGEPDSRNNANQDREYLSPARIGMWKIFDRKAGMWTAIFTGLLTVFTFLLYRVADRQDETARANERASLSFNGPTNGPRFTDATGQWIGQEIELNWVNSGTTPAKAVVIQTNAQAWPSRLPDGFGFPEEKGSRVNTVVGPKALYGTNAHVARADIMSAAQGKANIFFWGSVVYSDIFPGDRDRLTEFCISIDHLTFSASDFNDPKATLIAFQWQACKEHNCFDEDCKDYSAKVKELRTE